MIKINKIKGLELKEGFGLKKEIDYKNLEINVLKKKLKSMRNNLCSYRYEYKSILFRIRKLEKLEDIGNIKYYSYRKDYKNFKEFRKSFFDKENIFKFNNYSEKEISNLWELGKLSYYEVLEESMEKVIRCKLRIELLEEIINNKKKVRNCYNYEIENINCDNLNCKNCNRFKLIK